MTETTSPAPVSHPGLAARILGVLLSPRETFEAIAARPRWLGILAITLVIAAACQYIILSSPEMQDAMIAQATRNPNMSDQQIAATEQFIPRLAMVFAGVTLIFGPAITAII